MILASQQIKDLIEKKSLIQGFIDLNEQLQQAGFDITLEKVFSFKGKGTIDFDNKERSFPEFKEKEFENDFLVLPQGTYKVRFNEKVKLPGNIAAIAQTRSSLLRMGVHLNTALWDPGFEGKGESNLVVSNPEGVRIKKNAKIVQLVFIKLESESKKMYEGIHKN
ncbi:MAG TPA: deoxyuridine 5'-triphosphate nucleotidohydrolase [archaeon]|nr:deoxyuridine 5'-triphosphate nucleotidohydrolase [archaeon]